MPRPAFLGHLRRRLRFLRGLRFSERLRVLSRPRFLPRLGLRTRITIAFGVGALLLSTMVGATTWALTQQNWLDEQESRAIARTFTNANRVQQRITRGLDPTEMLSSLLTPSGSNPVLLLDESWYPVTPQYGEDALPTSLVEAVGAGRAARMRYEYLDETQLAVGVPLEPVDSLDAAYYEIVSLEELEDRLDSLGVSLIGASLATTLAGAGLGWWTSRRVIRPLTGVGQAAQAIATGHLDTRLEASRDPDLAPLADSFNDMAVALQERIARDSQFTSNVSHELRSPLTTLTSAIEVLQKKREDIPVEAHEALDLMDVEIQRFQQLVNDLLEISRFDTGVDQLELHEVRLAELVMHAIGTATEEDLPLDIDAELAGVVVKADKRRLARVIANLIDNAHKYGGGATRVELRKRDGDVLIAVEDDGPGVPEEDRERIFQRFNRGSLASRRRDVDGVGLGLALVAEHVYTHGGLVWAEAKPDGRSGARFVIALPTEEPAQS